MKMITFAIVSLLSISAFAYDAGKEVQCTVVTHKGETSENRLGFNLFKEEAQVVELSKGQYKVSLDGNSQMTLSTASHSGNTLSISGDLPFVVMVPAEISKLDTDLEVDCK